MQFDNVVFSGGFSIVPPPAGPMIGEAYGGGYYAGAISTTGNGVATHRLIIAPLATGASYSPGLRWRVPRASVSGTSSLIDGPTNSANMSAAGCEAAQFCEGLTIGGYSDWYLPAKNELEICYYNLKPTTTTNNVSSGINANSVPPRSSNYTSGIPTQTEALLFRAGAAQAFPTQEYWWSSTQYNVDDAWLQDFGSGWQRGENQSKDNPNYVRAVRRVPI